MAMIVLVCGIVVFVLSVMLFWKLLPTDGRVHRLIGTEYEPYLAVSVVFGAAVGLTLGLAGIVEMMG